MTMRRLLCATVGAALLCSPGHAGAIDPVKALPAQDFLETLGVGTHMEYTDGAYASASQAIEDLNFLGIHQLRDGVPDPDGGIPGRNFAVSLRALLDAGNKFDFLVAPRRSLAVFRNQVDVIAKDYPGSVIAVEGPNEINNWPVVYKGLAGDAGANAYQHDLYAMVQGDSALRAIPVYYLTGNRPIDLRAADKLADYANAHPYPNQGQPPGPRIASEFEHNFGMPPPYPKVITEIGYFNQPNGQGGSGVDDPTQAKLTLDLLFDAFQQGAVKTFLYQLRSAYPDPRGNNADAEYGLFNLDNSPKPVAIAIHDLTKILSDPGLGAPFLDTSSLAYSLSGVPDGGRSLLLQKSDGTFALVLWAEPIIWNAARHMAIAVPDKTVTLDLPAPARLVKVFDPLRSAVPLQTSANTTSVRVGVSDHPVVLEIQQ